MDKELKLSTPKRIETGDYGYWGEDKNSPCIVIKKDGHLRAFCREGEVTLTEIDEIEREFFDRKGNIFNDLT